MIKELILENWELILVGLISLLGTVLGFKAKNIVKELREFAVESAEFVTLLAKMPKNPDKVYWEKLKKEGGEAAEEFKDVIQALKKK